MKYLLLLALLTAGCSVHEVDHTFYDGVAHKVFVVQGNDSLYIDTIIAAEEWEDVCDVKLEVVNSPSSQGVRVYVDPNLEQPNAGKSRRRDNERDIILQPYLKYMERVNIIKHEIGHQLGVQHTPGTSGLMAWQENPEMSVTADLCPMIARNE